LAEIGLEAFRNQQFRKQNGCLSQVNFGSKAGECIVQVEPISANIYGASGDADDEEERMIATSCKDIGFRILLSKIESGHFEEEDSDLGEGSSKR
jgi:hypothetical protein